MLTVSPMEVVDNPLQKGLKKKKKRCPHVIPKTLEIVLDTALLNTQQYKVRIKGKVEQSR